ncbi:asparaginyl-tRNA synthetase [Buchnera aphidicola (Cinara tujafilina)]|uniref:Asparagine--tRNA ligase n=1 Tax=Buchnera aphidicola (Cinara tujafilina) TaxID=261317 RepID=F7WZF4_9GAMM|nr:asparagine--tRNA ligase [Buchnera aphidicola]AEH39816.1 asparaginyl-tRNA synthetase [Buchnera aphidicola (Cinara tujafilina)]
MFVISIYEIFSKIYILKNITIKGWVRSRRDSKKGLSFLSIYDGSTINIIQVVVKNSLNNYNTEILKLTIGCSVQIEGKLQYSHGKLQKYEILAKNITILGWIENPALYPMSAKKHTVEYIRNFCHLRSRTNLFGSITRIRNVIYHSLHNFLYKKNYFWISTPIITSINTEGAGSMFKVSMLDSNNIKEKKFFNKNVFLTVSGQLTLEAYACSLSNVYSFGPTFRAENSNTKRHLSEFWMLEVETAFSNLDNISKLSETLLKYTVDKVLNKCGADLVFLQKNIDSNIFCRLNSFLSIPFVRINYTDVINVLLKKSYEIKENISWGNDLSIQQERYLVEKYFKAPIIIQNYPKSLKAFYMRINSDNQTVSAIDVLLPNVGEIIGGSEREERLCVLTQRIHELGLNEKDYIWYQDLRKYGTVPHAGFGLGFERLIMYITGLKNIREAIPFPRTVKHADF